MNDWQTPPKPNGFAERQFDVEIAEYLGWSDFEWRKQKRQAAKYYKWVLKGTNPNGDRYKLVPDFANDADATRVLVAHFFANEHKETRTNTWLNLQETLGIFAEYDLWRSLVAPNKIICEVIMRAVGDYEDE